MGFFDRFSKKRETVIDEKSVEGVLLKAIFGDEEISRQDAMSLPAVSGWVDYICNTFASIPFKLYRESVVDDKRVTEEVNDPRVRLINDDTQDALDGFQFKKAMCEDYLMGQGGYAYIKKSKNEFVSLHYVEEKSISIQTNFDPIFKNYDIMVNGAIYKPFEFLKLLRNTKDGANGTGVTKEIGRALKTAFHRLKYDHELALTGGSRKGFLKSKNKLADPEMKKLKEAWQEYYSGNSSVVVLNNGMEFQEASNTSKENETNAKTITFNNELKVIFHIGATYEETIKTAIMPIVNAFTTALNRELLLEEEKKDHYYAADTKELYKGSMKERFEAYQIAIKNGFKTRNEIRYMEDDDAIKGLDVITLGLADVLMDAKTGTIYTPNTNSMVKMGGNDAEGITTPTNNSNNAASS